MLFLQECCGLIPEDKTFQEYLHDGTVLCRSVISVFKCVAENLNPRLIEEIQPGLIKRVNYAKSPFAWRVSLLIMCARTHFAPIKGLPHLPQWIHMGRSWGFDDCSFQIPTLTNQISHICRNIMIYIKSIE